MTKPAETYRIIERAHGRPITRTPENRDEAASLAAQMHERGVDVDIMLGDALVATYADTITVHDGYYAEDPRGHQSAGLHQTAQRIFGDTAGAAVHERRCMKEPMGCGTPFAGVCRTEFGGSRPCMEAADHTGDHTDADNYGGNMAVWTTFRSQRHFDEWTLVGLCQDCQDRMDKAAEDEMRERGEDPGKSWLDHTFADEQHAEAVAQHAEVMDMIHERAQSHFEDDWPEGEF